MVVGGFCCDDTLFSSVGVGKEFVVCGRFIFEMFKSAFFLRGLG